LASRPGSGLPPTASYTRADGNITGLRGNPLPVGGRCVNRISMEQSSGSQEADDDQRRPRTQSGLRRQEASQHVRDDQARLGTRQVTLLTNPRWSANGLPGIFHVRMDGVDMVPSASCPYFQPPATPSPLTKNSAPTAHRSRKPSGRCCGRTSNALGSSPR